MSLLRFVAVLTSLGMIAIGNTRAADSNPANPDSPLRAQDLGPIYQWTAPAPNASGSRGYPKLPKVEVIRLTDGKFGKLNHHPILQRIDDNFYVMHTHHPGHHESYSGRNVGGWVGNSDGTKWIGPLVLFPPMSPVENEIATAGQRLQFGCQFHKARDGNVYALARVGYKSWPNGIGGNKSADHFHTGFLARTISSAGELGPVFWIDLVEDLSKDKWTRDVEDRTDSEIARELMAAGPWDNIRGRGLSPDGIREPGPHRRHATESPKSQRIGEFETAFLDTIEMGTTTRSSTQATDPTPLAVCLTRTIPNNNGDPCHWMAYSRDRGETWSEFTRTNIPCAYNRSAIGQLPDGRIYIIGSLAPTGQQDRRPLAIAISDDGEHFSKVYRLLDERVHTIRNDLVHDGFIWIATSYGGSGRQDVAVVKIPIEQLKE